MDVAPAQAVHHVLRVLTHKSITERPTRSRKAAQSESINLLNYIYYIEF